MDVVILVLWIMYKDLRRENMFAILYPNPLYLSLLLTQNAFYTILYKILMYLNLALLSFHPELNDVKPTLGGI